MIFDAVILAGGRSSRLGGTPKSGLVLGASTLLGHTLDAVTDAARIVVVGDDSTVADALAGAAVSPRVSVVREQPPFSGPAAAIAAGVDELTRTGGPAEWVFVLACDVPAIADIADSLLRARSGTEAGEVQRGSGPDAFSSPDRFGSTDGPGSTDGFVAADQSGHPQFVLGLYRAESLGRAVNARRADGFVDLSVRALLGSLAVTIVQAEAGATDDVDTWSDAERFGIAVTSASAPAAAPAPAPVSKPSPSPSSSPEPSIKRRNSDEELEVLREWHKRLSSALGVGTLPDVTGDVLRLAGVAAHALVRPAAPLTTFIAGYAAGVEAASGRGGSMEHLRLVLERAERLAEGGLATADDDSSGR